MKIVGVAMVTTTNVLLGLVAFAEATSHAALSIMLMYNDASA